MLDTPLIERKQILDEFIEEKDRIAVSRYIWEKGTRLFPLTIEKELEGVVAKKASSRYLRGYGMMCSEEFGLRSRNSAV